MKKLKGFLLCTIIFGVLLTTACSPSEDKTGDAKANAAYSIEDKEGSQKVINEYFGKLYSKDIKEYNLSTVNGEIDESVKSYISKDLLDASGNENISIHNPRYVLINDKVITKYKFINGKTPEIVSSYIGKEKDEFLFYVKVNMLAEAVDKNEFNNNYEWDKTTGIYQEKVPSKNIDEIKVQAKYNVKIIKEDSGYKILKAEESSLKAGVKDRIYVNNNDYINRVSYLSVSNENDVEINKDDEKIFQDEKKLIEDFLEKFKSIDNEDKKMLSSAWNINLNEFNKYIKKYGMDSMVDVNDNYKKSFQVESFPVRLNMKSINNISNTQVVVHPYYSKNNHIYIVKFKAMVIMDNGMPNNTQEYSYEYTFNIKDMKINGLALNAVSREVSKKTNSEQK